MSTETVKAGIVSCSGEAIAEGTISRLAVRRVLELLRPNSTVTLCLPLFLSGNEAERNFARTHPVITIDGCGKLCAKSGTEAHSGPVSSALVVTEILGTQAAGCHRSARHASQADEAAVWAVAERLAAEVDTVLAQTAPRGGEAPAAGGARCSCSSPAPEAKLVVLGKTAGIPGLEAIFAQCAARNVATDDAGSAALLEAVKIYHRILPGEEAAYRAALLAAYRSYRAGSRPAQ